MLEQESDKTIAVENGQASPQAVERQPKMRGDIILIPQPSDDSADPLNWKQRKKYMMLGILSLAAFTSHVTALANQLGVSAQAGLYHNSLNDMADTISTCIAGLVGGPLFLVPLTHVFGYCSILFWSMIAAACGSVWSALMTGPDQYIPFIISRLFVGLFSASPTILGPQMLVNIFFLHERGTVFNTFMVWSSLGVVVGPTLGGFVVQHAPWPWEFWWTVALQGAVILLYFLFLEETGYTRKNEWVYPPQPSGFVQNRLATYFPGTRVAHVDGVKEVVSTEYINKLNSVELTIMKPHAAMAQILIGISPVTLLAGTYLLVMSGWFVAFNTLLSVFLQEPVESGGYGFSAQQNAAFTFTLWIGTIVAQVWGHFLNDRIPLYFTRRYSGTWKPEYRLHALWVPSFLMPISLGFVGASFEYHLHYMVLAVGSFLVTFSATCLNPVAINYLVECFMKYPTELNSILGVYRLGLGLAIPFFINTWVAQFGVGWVFGTQALLSIVAFVPIVILMFYGHALRSMGFEKLHRDEEGTKIINKG